MPERHRPHRGYTYTIQAAERLAEQETLLTDEERPDDDADPVSQSNEPCVPNPHANLPVYATIHR